MSGKALLTSTCVEAENPTKTNGLKSIWIDRIVNTKFFLQLEVNDSKVWYANRVHVVICEKKLVTNKTKQSCKSTGTSNFSLTTSVNKNLHVLKDNKMSSHFLSKI